MLSRQAVICAVIAFISEIETPGRFMMPICTGGSAGKPSAWLSTFMPVRSADSGITDTAMPASTAAATTVQDQLVNRIWCSRPTASSAEQASWRHWQSRRPTASGTGASSRIGMIGRADQQSGSVRTTSGHALARIVGDKRDIELALVHALGKVHRRLADDVELDVRMRLGKAADDLGHVAVGIVVGRADAQHTLQPVVVKSGDRFIVEADDAPGVIEQLLALDRQPVAAAILDEELLADALFEAAHLHGDGRLSLVDLVGRLGEAAGIDDGDESLQLVEIKRCGHGVTHKDS